MFDAPAVAPTEAIEPAPVAAPPVAVTDAATPPLTRRARRAAAAAAAPVAPVEVPAAVEKIEPIVVPTIPAPIVAAPVETEAFELLEPVVEQTPTATLIFSSADAESGDVESTANRADAASVADEFDLAAQLFAFTGEHATQAPHTEAAPAPEEESEQAKPAASAAHTAAPRPRRFSGESFRRVTAASFSVGVMGVVGLLAVGMTTPATAVTAPANTSQATTSLVAAGATEVDEDEIQAYVAPVGAQPAAIQREGSYDTVTFAEIASESGVKNFSDFYVNNPNSPIQWPYPVGVSISYGFGMRDGAMHSGADFTPGDGAPIHAIANGVVRVATEGGGGYGVHVIIDHEINGQLVSSHYAHMQYGSLQVTPGQQITVGTVLGRTGNTGRSFGSHLHFEILAGGTEPIDPIAWMREHAGG